MPNRLLGKLPARHDPRTLKMSKYLTPALPPIPDDYSWVDKDQIQSWGMMKNDVYGDCVIAMFGHLIMGWTASNGNLFIPSDDEVLAVYAAITGFNPVTGSNDNGTNELDALNYMAKTGMAGHKIGAYVSVDPTNVQEVKAAIYLFGGLAGGVSLPLNVQNTSTWDVPPDDGNQDDPTAGSWGGHGVPILGFSSDIFNIITWGAPLNANTPFVTKYFDELYAIISPDFVNGTKPAPNGFNMDQLVADLEAVKAA